MDIIQESGLLWKMHIDLKQEFIMELLLNEHLQLLTI